MYQTPIDVLKKSEEEFKRERHLPDGGGQRAAVASVPTARTEVSSKQEPKRFSFAGLRLKQRLEWSTEELLLLLLIVWQLFCREQDYLLVGVLLFLLLFD